MKMFFSFLAEYYSNILIKRKLQGNFFDRYIYSVYLSILWKIRVWLELNLVIFRRDCSRYLPFTELLYEYALLLSNISEFVDVDIYKLNYYHNFYPVFIVRNDDGIIDYIKYAVVIDSKTVVSIIVKEKENGKHDLGITVSIDGKEIMFHYQKNSRDQFNRNIQKVLSKTLRRIIYRNTKNILFKTVNKL